MLNNLLYEVKGAYFWFGVDETEISTIAASLLSTTVINWNLFHGLQYKMLKQ